MLIDEPMAMGDNPILSMIAALNGRNAQPRHIQTGVYEVGHFGGSAFLRNYDHYPSLNIGSYGVCDSVEQLLQKCPALVEDGRQFVITVAQISRADQPSDGGWCWHKWGEYIGDKSPQCEYLHDEPEIEEVLVYHIYEKR